MKVVERWCALAEKSKAFDLVVDHQSFEGQGSVYQQTENACLSYIIWGDLDKDDCHGTFKKTIIILRLMTRGQLFLWCPTTFEAYLLRYCYYNDEQIFVATILVFLYKNVCSNHTSISSQKCPGLTCGINIVKPRFLFKTVDLWSYILPFDRYSHTL